MRPPREWKITGSNPACAEIFFRGRVIPVTEKLALQWLPCEAHGIIGSVLGLVGSVSCDWVRWKVWSATSISVWQHIKLSEQIRPWDTLACCWDVKQPANKHHKMDALPQSHQGGENYVKTKYGKRQMWKKKERERGEKKREREGRGCRRNEREREREKGDG